MYEREPKGKDNTPFNTNNCKQTNISYISSWHCSPCKLRYFLCCSTSLHILWQKLFSWSWIHICTIFLTISSEWHLWLNTVSLCGLEIVIISWHQIRGKWGRCSNSCWCTGSAGVTEARGCALSWCNKTAFTSIPLILLHAAGFNFFLESCFYCHTESKSYIEFQQILLPLWHIYVYMSLASSRLWAEDWALHIWTTHQPLQTCCTA